MVQDPVKGSRAENAIKHSLEWKILQIGSRQQELAAKIGREVVLCGGQHILRQVYADNPTSRQALQQLSCQPPGAATCVHKQLIATQVHSSQDFLTPTDLWPGDSMVLSGIPLAGLGGI